MTIKGRKRPDSSVATIPMTLPNIVIARSDSDEAICFEFRTFDIWICFEFRASDFGFKN